MPKNKLSDLRDHLFETLEQLKDKEEPMEIPRAKAIADVAQVIINSATVEIKALNAMNVDIPSFFGGEKKPAPELAPATHQRNGKSVRPSIL